uniref:Uncharacterized protein n=1 Tax=Glossina morsitans morsitans TaxID=37546 RepID=A0A1B0FE18_GLOMM
MVPAKLLLKKKTYKEQHQAVKPSNNKNSNKSKYSQHQQYSTVILIIDTSAHHIQNLYQLKQQTSRSCIGCFYFY